MKFRSWWWIGVRPIIIRYILSMFFIDHPEKKQHNILNGPVGLSKTSMKWDKKACPVAAILSVYSIFFWSSLFLFFIGWTPILYVSFFILWKNKCCDSPEWQHPWLSTGVLFRIVTKKHKFEMILQDQMFFGLTKQIIFSATVLCIIWWLIWLWWKKQIWYDIWTCKSGQ